MTKDRVWQDEKERDMLNTRQDVFTGGMSTDDPGINTITTSPLSQFDPVGSIIYRGCGSFIMTGDGDDYIFASPNNDTIYSNGGDDQIYAGSGNDYINAGDGNDVVFCEDGNDYALGSYGNDSLVGGAGNDTLDGGAGTDTMCGGTGNDTYVVDSAGDIVFENASEGIDTVQSSVTYTLGDNIENLTLTGTDAINGEGNDLNNVIEGNGSDNILIGHGGNDLLYGDEGGDTLDGGGGADTMCGGTGNDTYIIDDLRDTIIENTDGGVDTVQSSITYTLGNNLENLILEEGSDAVYGYGNDLDNVITGNSADNVLYGDDGNDTPYGNDGNDTLWGQGGNDSLYGGGGNDWLDGGTGTDTMSGGFENDTYVIDDLNDKIIEYRDAGTDTVRSPFTYTLGGNLENLTLTGDQVINGYGNELDNFIIGNDANNILKGGAGNDTIYSGAGNDTLYGNYGDDYLVGYRGSDTYIFGKNDGSDTIYDIGLKRETDVISFDSSVSRDTVAFFKNGSDLSIAYGDTDYIIVSSQGFSYEMKDTGIEDVQLSDGLFLADSDINTIIQDITSYANDHGISLTSVDDVKGNQDLMNIIVNAWHQ